MPEELENLIATYFKMNDGEHIKNFQNEILIFQEEITIKITHRTLKHIVEQRKRDKYSDQDLLDFFRRVTEVLKNKNYKILENDSIKSFLLVETVFEKTVGVVLVLEIIFFGDNSYYIKTGFYRAVTKIKKLLKQK